jgi:hypothetical protein
MILCWIDWLLLHQYLLSLWTSASLKTPIFGTCSFWCKGKVLQMIVQLFCIPLLELYAIIFHQPKQENKQYSCTKFETCAQSDNAVALCCFLQISTCNLGEGIDQYFDFVEGAKWSSQIMNLVWGGAIVAMEIPVFKGHKVVCRIALFTVLFSKS